MKKITQTNKNSRLLPNSGFTLVEIIIVVLLFAIMIGTLYNLLDGYGKIRVYGEAQIITVEQGRAAMDEIAKYAAQSRRVLTSQTINGIIYASNAMTLVLQLPAINGNGDIVDGAWDYAAFYLSVGSRLYRSSEPNVASARPAGTKFLSDSVSGIQFTYDNADFAQVRNVSASIQTQHMARNKTVESNIAEQITLKNY